MQALPREGVRVFCLLEPARFLSVQCKDTVVHPKQRRGEHRANGTGVVDCVHSESPFPWEPFARLGFRALSGTSHKGTSEVTRTGQPEFRNVVCTRFPSSEGLSGLCLYMWVTYFTCFSTSVTRDPNAVLEPS